MPDRQLTVTVCRKRWLMKFTKLHGADGWCLNPSKPGKKILVSSRKRSRQHVLEDVLHELLHAADWTKDEEWVTDVARDFARILVRLETMGIIGELSDG